MTRSAPHFLERIAFLLVVLAHGLHDGQVGFAQAELPDEIVPKTGLLLRPRSDSNSDQPEERRRGRTRYEDPLAEWIVHQGLHDYHPLAGQELRGSEQTTYVWSEIELDEQGAVAQSDSRDGGSYLYVPFESDRQRVMILAARRHSIAYFNGEPRTGNVYGSGYADVPVLMQPGTNHLLLQPGRGSLAARLYAPPAEVFILGGDLTLPDSIIGETMDAWGAAVVINASPEPARAHSIVARGPALNTPALNTPALDTTVTELPEIPPLSLRKVGFRLQGTSAAESDPAELAVTLDLRSPGQASPVHTVQIKLRVRGASDPHRRTFVSDLDGSVQYYALRPAVPLSGDDPAPAIVLSCHGAAVEAMNQANAYATKSWLHLVAPTNRRPYGFDWEDFGRLDALEVLRIAKQTLHHDPSRIYLTGHSMGGHGAWHLGVTYPDLFAAIGPSAAWISRSTYGSRRGGDEDRELSPVDRLVRRSGNVGDTIGLADNLQHQGVYILHGADDDNVPVSQARQMAELLGETHDDWSYHEEPGKRHWWSNDYADGGNASVDWPFMFDMFARHALPPVAAVRHVSFTTANPGVSSRCDWLHIEGQIRHDDFSHAKIDTWPNRRQFSGTTENVAILRLDTMHLRSHEPMTVVLDGQKIENIEYPEHDGSLWLRRDSVGWQVIAKPSLSMKGPHRYGPIKNELQHHLLFVYGTAGDAEENQWSFAKARYDSETFWYRGNASVDVIADIAFAPADNPDPKYADRSVVLFGNADTNSAWEPLLGRSPVQVRRGSVAIGARQIEGDDLCAVMIRPRMDSEIASVAVVSGTGPIGMRLADQLSFFTPFVRYPDCLVSRPSQGNGNDRSGHEPVVAGYFGLDWTVENGEFVWAGTTGNRPN